MVLYYLSYNNIKIFVLINNNYMEFITASSLRDNYTEYIYINPDSLDKDTCSEIVTIFDNEPNKRDGRTVGGVNKDVKSTSDIIIPMVDSTWGNIYVLLKRELMHNVGLYTNKINKKDDFRSINNNTKVDDFCILKSDLILYEHLMVQKYTQNLGRYIYHNDFVISPDDKTMRVLTFLWYLNDVSDGGETVFDGKYAIRPKSGTLIIFPSSWVYPHCGKMPKSNDKYIITGWLYVKY